MAVCLSCRSCQKPRVFKNLLPSRPGTEPLADALVACRTHFVWAAVFSALVNLLYLTPTLYMLQIYDRVVPTGGLTTLVFITGVAVFALATLAGLDWLRTRLLLRAGLRLDRLLAGKVLARVVDLQTRAPNTQALREFDNVRGALSGPGMLAVLDAPWTPIYLGACFLLHPALGLLTLVGGGMLFILAWLNERDSRPRLARAIQSSNTAYAAQENIAGQTEVVRALGMRQASINRQIEQRRLATAGHADAQFAGGRYTGAIKFLRLTLQSLSLGLAAFLAVRGQISAGAIIAASVLLSRAVAPVELLVGAWPGLVQARTSWKALNDLFAGTAARDLPRTALPAPAGALAVEGVTVRLSDSEAPQLRGASFKLSPGQTLGVVGASGSGKTTLARVLAGALKPTAGTVRLDGAEYDARDGDAGAHEMIQRLPHGYDTVLGPFGQGLSTGQAQRVALARALYGDPILLVLDEPNSNLDQEGESALMSAILAAAARGAAVVIVAHRAGVLARVDRLLVLRDGAIQQEGPREEVLDAMRAPRPAEAVKR